MIVAEVNKGDASILRFLAAAEIIESDFWEQYWELGGTQLNDFAATIRRLAQCQLPLGATGRTQPLSRFWIWTYLNIFWTIPMMSLAMRTSCSVT